MIGETIGNYKVLSLLGAGGMGEVYLAEQISIETRVAIKVLQTQVSKDADQVQRFFNEARAVSKVRHAGTVKIFDCGFHKDHAYLVMEFLDGESLAARIRRLGSLSGEQVADIGRQIAGVLDAVHAVGITHRDLKPDNIFLIPDHELASGERVKVLDFGIAKLSGTMSGHSPQTKGTMGTPAYMAPEQWNNAASVDGRADTYSLGCVMFEMAVGKPPFPSNSIGEACTHHLHSKPPRASELAPQIPPQFDTLVDRMLDKRSDSRPSIKEIARAFDELRSSGATARWHASQVSAAMAVQVPATMPSQPAQYLPPHHSPGMQNPMYGATAPQHPPYPAPQHPPYPTPQHPHAAPYPGHTTMPRGEAQAQSPSSKKGWILGGVGVVVAGGVAVAVIVASGSGSSASGSPTTTAPIGGATSTTPDATAHGIAESDQGLGERVPQPGPKPSPDPKPDKAPRETLAATNAFTDVFGVQLLSKQVTVADYKLVMGKAPPEPGADDEPAAWLTQAEATAFCAAIGARLPTSDEWSRAAKGAWGIAVGDVAGPLQEWTSTIQDDLVVVRGGHAKMTTDALAKAAKQKPPYFLQKDTGDASSDCKAVAGATIGFRCADGPQKPSVAAVAPAKPSTPGSTIGSINTIGSIGGSTGGSTGGIGTIGTRRTITPGGANVRGTLPKEMIRRVIQARVVKIRHCYERALESARPDLQGTVTATFTIGPEGTVTTATATGMDTEVAACVATVIRSMRFPKPEGGGSVTVNYPFAFRPGDP